MAGKRIALLVDAFPPLRSSGAVQLRDLSRQLADMGYEPTVLVPAPDLEQPHEIVEVNGVRVFRFRSMRTKDVGRVRRALAERALSFVLLWRLGRSALRAERWDGVVFYSPTIFLGHAARKLARASGCRAYLIVRDIFPEWAVDMGVMGRGIAYRYFKRVERYQYRVADIIGVQSPANLAYHEFGRLGGTQVEVLHNWLRPPPEQLPALPIDLSGCAGAPVVVYAGNMGVAQGLDAVLRLAERVRDRSDARFVFVGRGSEKSRLEAEAKARGLDNVLFFSEIEPDAVWALYEAADLGIVSLAPALTTHNIPGKFLTYMYGGLPVLACINPGNDLEQIIVEHGVGACCVSDSDEALETAFTRALELAGSPGVAARCTALAKALFSASAAATQIVRGLGIEQAVSGSASETD